MLSTELNYSLLSWAVPCKILEMAGVETPSNRATSANDIPNSFLTELVESHPARSKSLAPQKISSLFDILPSGWFQPFCS